MTPVFLAVLAGLVATLSPSFLHAGAFDSLEGNSWRRANPPARTVYQSAVHATDATQPDRCLTTVTRGEPVSRTYSGLAVGGGKVFNFGGGHSSHPGNDVELYDPLTNAWAANAPPECPGNGSPMAKGIVGAGGATPAVTPLGRPYSQHSYKQCAHDTVRSRFVCVYASGTWSYVLSTNAWKRLRVPEQSPQWSTGYGGVVYDSKADRILAFVTSPHGTFGGSQRGVYVLHPSSGEWTYRGAFPALWHDRTPIAAYNPDAGETLLHVGPFGLWRYVYAAHTWTQVAKVPGIVRDGYANFDYDTRSKVFAFLVTPMADPPRAAAVWTWNPMGGAWTRQATPTVVPVAYPHASGSEMGHFVYVPEANVFVYVESQTLYCGLGGGWGCGGNAVTWIYRLADATAATPPPAPLTRTLSASGTGAGTMTGPTRYASSTVVTMTAAPVTGSAFGGWSGDDDCTDRTVTVTAAVSCIATFTPASTSPSPPPPPRGNASLELIVAEPGTGAHAPGPITRVRDLVTTGMPVPPDAIGGPWALTAGDAEVPIQVTPLKGNWILLDFQTDLVGHGTKRFTLENRAPTVPVTNAVTVTEAPTGATVITGPLKMTIQRATLAPFTLRLVTSTGASSPAQPPTAWAWEAQGPIRATLRADGTFASGLGYTLRLTFRAGQNDVTAQVILRNSRATGYRHEKVKSATLTFGAAGTPVRSTGFGTTAYVPCATGCAFEVIPAWDYADQAANGGLLIPDMSHWGAEARLDFDGGLSAGETTRRFRSATYPLMALAPAETYAPALSATMSTLQDEKDANTRWGWTWTTDQVPTVPHRAYPGITWRYVDVHGDTEADDTWQNIAMWVRTGVRGYWDRARSWARYMMWHYTHRTDGWTYGATRTKGSDLALTAADQAHLAVLEDGRLDIDSYQADHFYGWGLLDWYLISGDPLALEAAGDLLEESRKVWGHVPDHGLVYGLRSIARHLLFATRYHEVTGDPGARAHADHIWGILKRSPAWNEPWGMYLWANSSATRPKAVSPFHIAILHHAMERYWLLTGDTEVKRRMLRMSDFAMAHGLHPTFKVGVYEVAVDYPGPGQVWHGGFTATTPVNPYYSAVWVDMLVRAAQMTGEAKYLDRAVLHWEKASKITYRSLYNQPNAGPKQVGKYTGFLNQRLGSCCSVPDSIYFELNGFLPYAHRLHRAVAGR